MKVQVKVFPITGLCNQSQKLELALGNGNFSEVLTLLAEKLGVSFDKFEKLMFLHNGRGLDRKKDVVLCDGDELWLLPLISGG